MRVGGFDVDQRGRPPSSDDLATAWRPSVETCVALFGPDRCPFESNFPVDKGMVGFRILWNGCRRLAAALSEDEKQALFAGTARRVHRLDRAEP